MCQPTSAAPKPAWFSEAVARRHIGLGPLSLAAALGEGVETHTFFTFWGLDIIHETTVDHLKFTILGNTASHMPQGIGGLPGMTALATHKMKKQMHELDIPDVREFVQMISDAGGLVACLAAFVPARAPTRAR